MAKFKYPFLTFQILRSICTIFIQGACLYLKLKQIKSVTKQSLNKEKQEHTGFFFFFLSPENVAASNPSETTRLNKKSINNPLINNKMQISRTQHGTESQLFIPDKLSVFSANLSTISSVRS